MRITKIQIFDFEKENSKIKAFVNVTLDNVFVVHGIKIVEGKNGVYVSMPSRKNKDGKHLEIAHPINKKFSNIMNTLILKRYQTHIQKKQQQNEHNKPNEHIA